MSTVTWTATSNVYAPHPAAEQLDVLDHLQARVAQLEAMTTIIAGEGFDSFSRWSDEIRSTYVYGIAMLASEVRELAGRLG